MKFQQTPQLSLLQTGTLRSVAALAMMMFLVSCGQEKDDQGMLNSATSGQMDSSIIGTWVPANLAAGADNPSAKGCIAGEGNSKTSEMVIADKQLSTITQHFIGTADCSGGNTVTITEVMAIVIADDNGSTLITPTSYSRSATVAGAGAVTALNDAEACGKSDWQAKSYDADAEHLINCTDANSKDSFIDRHSDEASISALLIKIEKQGTGISYSLKPGAIDYVDFSSAEYFTAKP